MYKVSERFKSQVREAIKEIDVYFLCEGKKYAANDVIVSIKIESESTLNNVAMEKVTVDVLGVEDFLNKEIELYYGVKIDDTYEYINKGKYIVNSNSIDYEKETTQFVAYDYIIKTMTKYESLDLMYPTDVLTFTKALLEKCGLELSNDSFLNSDLMIEEDLFLNIKGIINREILRQIAELSNTMCILRDNKVYFKNISEVCEELKDANLISYKVDKKYGKVNSLVISRMPQNDNIYAKDDIDISNNGLCEYKIKNNEFINKKRDEVKESLFNSWKGFEIYAFNCTTEGHGYYNIGDLLLINGRRCLVLKYSLNIAGSFKETLGCKEIKNTNTKYEYASETDRRINNAELIVDKQNQKIKSIVKTQDKIRDMNTTVLIEQNNISSKIEEIKKETDNTTSKVIELKQNLEGLNLSIERSGGLNFIRNSAMYDNDFINNKVKYWELSKTGNINVKTAVNFGLSGNLVILNDKTIKQVVNVQPDSDYVFGSLINKDIGKKAYIKLYNETQEFITELNNEEYRNKEITIKFKSHEPTINVELYGELDSNFTITDMMLTYGTIKTPWQQANGEIMNTNVINDIDGIKVYSDTNKGSYTIMSPREFSGYSDINGKSERVFGLDKDVTITKKIKTRDEISMPPLKILAIKDGNVKGWAFVESEEKNGG